MKFIPSYILLFLLFVLSACSNDPYDTGDGSLSHMRADFVEAQTDASANIISIETDDGEHMFLTNAINVSWAERPDTVYRALLYYNKVEADDGTNNAEPLGISQVLVPQITPIEEVKDGIKTDPVTFESSWTSRNGKYLNLDLSIKTGSVNGDFNTQTIGIICTGVDTDANGRHHVSLRLYHDQNGVPEYYSAEAYVSIAVSRLPIVPVEGDEVAVEINTYDGTITRTFTF